MKEMETMISSREGGGGKVFYLLWQTMKLQNFNCLNSKEALSQAYHHSNSCKITPTPTRKLGLDRDLSIASWWQLGK